MGRLFGTDGIRGCANQYPITVELATKVGKALAIFVKAHSSKKIILGKDTRMSGDMIEAALMAGITSMGIDASTIGVLSTPGIAFTTINQGAAAGIAVSASHNPFYDNGIKIFKSDGFKLTDEEEGVLEGLIFDDNQLNAQKIRQVGRITKIKNTNEMYLDFLINTLPHETRFHNLKIVLDCSHGATYKIAPQLFESLGAKVTAISIAPDGLNINDQVGPEHPGKLAQAVLKHQADVGLAFDGDGDRLIAVDEKGQTCSGDQIIAIVARQMKKDEKLKNNIVVTTIMSNLGLGQALKEDGITHYMTDVGDRYVLAKMRATDAVLGGEDSGHMIFLNHLTTGDGLLSALRLLKAIKNQNKPLSELRATMTVFPQVLMGVEVAEKKDFHQIPEILKTIKQVEHNLDGQGRVNVRYSGTQPILRVMVEGPTNEETTKYCQQICDVVEAHLGK